MGCITLAMFRDELGFQIPDEKRLGTELHRIFTPGAPLRELETIVGEIMKAGRDAGLTADHLEAWVHLLFHPDDSGAGARRTFRFSEYHQPTQEIPA